LPLELYERWRDDVLHREGVKRIETRLQRRDGTPVDVSLTLSPLHGLQDAITGFSAIIKDVTQEKQLQEQFFRSEKLSALGEMAAGIAHNFNNMLMTILTQVQLLARDPTNVEAVQHGLAMIKTGVEDGAAMVRRIQQFARAGTEEGVTLIDLNSVVHKVIETTQLIWKDHTKREYRSIDVVLDLVPVPPVRGRLGE